MKEEKPTYEEMESRLAEAEEIVETLQQGQADAIVSQKDILVLRLRQMEDALRKSESRLRTLIENLPFSFWAMDNSGRYVVENSESRRMWGDRIGKTPTEVGPPPPMLEIWENNNSRAFAGEMVDEEETHQWDGVERVFRNIVAPVRVEDEIEGILGVNIDVTVEKKAEAYLQRLVEQRTSDLRIMASKLAEAQEEERQRIAAGLHDEIGQLLAACQFRFSQAYNCGKERRRELLEEANEILNNASDQLRDLTFELKGCAIFQAGFVAAAKELCVHMEKNHGVRFNPHCPQDDISVPEDLCPILYQALRELLHNVVKHADVKTAEVRIEVLGDGHGRTGRPSARSSLRITVLDSGKGFDKASLYRPLTRDGGFGLYHLRERLGEVGGKLKIESVPGEGTESTVEVPLQPLYSPRE